MPAPPATTTRVDDLRERTGNMAGSGGGIFCMMATKKRTHRPKRQDVR